MECYAQLFSHTENKVSQIGRFSMPNGATFGDIFEKICQLENVNPTTLDICGAIVLDMTSEKYVLQFTGIFGDEYKCMALETIRLQNMNMKQYKFLVSKKEVG